MKKNYRALLSAVFVAGITQAASAQIITTYAGNGTAAFGGDAAPATAAQLSAPNAVATDAAGNVYIADYNNHRIRKVAAGTGIITTFAGTGMAAYFAVDDGGPATAARIKMPAGMAFDAAGNMYFCDFGNNLVRKISTTGIITTIAGVAGSLPSYAGDGGPATAANLGNPTGVAVHPTGDILIADQQNHAIRRINSSGIISTIVGNGLIGTGAAGDGGLANLAKLNEPTDVAVDAAGNIFIADNGNNRVRKINISTGIISTLAGVVAGTVPGPLYGFAGDGGPATAARLYYPQAIATDGPGNVYISDWSNHAIRKVNTSGLIYTIAGIGLPGFTGDGGLADAARLKYPTDVAVRADGDVFIADNENNRIRRVKIGNEPYFSAGASKNVIICPIEFTVLDSALRVDDIDVGQTLSWSPVVLPSHGTLAATYSTTSTGSTVTPSGLSYAPAVGYTGPDNFSVRVTDGTYSDTILIVADVIPAPTAGTISGADSVCPGQTVIESSTVTGGTWSSSDISKATVSTTGAVTGVAAGTITLTYTVTGFCGSVIAVKTIKVIATVPCVNAVQKVVREGDGIKITPNPSNGTFVVNIASDTKENVHVQILDVTGRSVWNQEIPANKDMQLSPRLVSGMYMMHVTGQDRRAVKKLVIE